MEWNNTLTLLMYSLILYHTVLGLISIVKTVKMHKREREEKGGVNKLTTQTKEEDQSKKEISEIVLCSFNQSGNGEILEHLFATALRHRDKTKKLKEADIKQEEVIRLERVSDIKERGEEIPKHYEGMSYRITSKREKVYLNESRLAEYIETLEGKGVIFPRPDIKEKEVLYMSKLNYIAYKRTEEALNTLLTTIDGEIKKTEESCKGKSVWQRRKEEKELYNRLDKMTVTYTRTIPGEVTKEEVELVGELLEEAALMYAEVLIKTCVNVEE